MLETKSCQLPVSMLLGPSDMGVIDVHWFQQEKSAYLYHVYVTLKIKGANDCTPPKASYFC